MKITTGVQLIVNAPEFFEDPAFVAWLNTDETKMTWHRKGNSVPDEYSDVVVFVDPSLNGEGSDGESSGSSMPAYIWHRIVVACREYYSHPGAAKDEYIAVRITNLA